MNEKLKVTFYNSILNFLIEKSFIFFIYFFFFFDELSPDGDSLLPGEKIKKIMEMMETVCFLGKK